MDTEIIDNLNGKCANCGQMHPSDQLFLAELRVGTEISRQNLWGGNTSAIVGYRMSGNLIQLEICTHCIRQKQFKQWRNVGIAALISGSLISIDYYFQKFSFFGFLGIAIGGVLLLVIPKLTYKKLTFCDEIALKLFRKGLPDELRKDRNFTVFTREHMKNTKEIG